MKSGDKKSKYRADMILAAIILLVAVLSFLFYSLGRSPGVTVEVLRDNTIEAEFPLNEYGSYTLYNMYYGKNTLVISDGKARITEADCPDGLCIHQGEISKQGEVLVCLPHKLVINIRGGEEAELDAVSE